MFRHHRGNVLIMGAVAQIILFAILSSFAVTGAGTESHTKERDVNRWAPGKPGAPVSVRWLDSDEGSRIRAQLLPLADYEEIEVRVVVAGDSRERSGQRFGPGAAGETLDLDWPAGDKEGEPRLIVIMTSSGRRMSRVLAHPKSREGHREDAAAEKQQGRILSSERLVVLPAHSDAPR